MTARRREWAEAAGAVLALLAVAVVIDWRALSRAPFFYDVAIQNLPYRAFFADGLRQGMVRWWAGEMGAGFPLFAESQAGGAYRGNLLFWLLPTAWFAYSCTAILHLFWAGLGTGCFARQMGLSRAAALAAGIAYMLCGPVYFRELHLNVLQGLAWLPWAFWAAERGVRGLRFGFVALGVVSAMQWLTGHVQPPMITGLGVLPYGLARAWQVHRPALDEVLPTAGVALGFGLLVAALRLDPGHGPVYLIGLAGGAAYLARRPRSESCRRWLWSGLGLAGAAGLGLVLAAVQLLPLAELSGQSVRSGGMDVQQSLSMSLLPGQLSGFLLPRLHGAATQFNLLHLVRFGQRLQWEWVPHCGVVVAVLALLSPWLGRRRERWVFLGLAAVFLVLAMGRTFPFYRWLLAVPGWSLVRGPARLLPLVAFGLAVAAAMTIDELAAAGVPERRRKPIELLLLAAAAVTCAAAVVMIRHTEGLFEPAHRAAYGFAWVRAAGLMVASAALILGRSPAGPTRVWLALAVGLVLVDLSSGSAGYHPLVDPGVYAPPPDAELARSADGERIRVPVDTPHPLQPAQHLLYPGLSNVANFSPIRLARMARLDALLGDQPDLGSVVVRRWLALLRVKAVSVREADEGPARLAPTGLRLFPRAWLTPRWERATSPAEALAMVQRPDWRPEAYAVVEEPTTVAPRRGRLGTITWSRFGRHRVTCLVTCDQAQVLVLSQAWYPGWRVAIDGSWQPARPVDYVLCGVRLPAGARRVDFVFCPITLRLGLFVSLLGMAALLGYAIHFRPPEPGAGR